MREHIVTDKQIRTLAPSDQLTGELGLTYNEAVPGARVEGVYRRPIDLVGGRYALIENSLEFSLVPWRQALEPQVGRYVSGIARASGIDWTFGRGRGGPAI